jgi:hypothetical protein
MAADGVKATPDHSNTHTSAFQKVAWSNLSVVLLDTKLTWHFVIYVVYKRIIPAA